MALKLGINSKRTDFSGCTDPQLVTPYWFLGHLRWGEGTFGFRSIVPYFQVAQKTTSQGALKAITLFLEGLPRVYTDTLTTSSPNVCSTFNKRTDVVTLSISDIDVLYDYILPFFAQLHFLSRS